MAFAAIREGSSRVRGSAEVAAAVVAEPAVTLGELAGPLLPIYRWYEDFCSMTVIGFGGMQSG